MIKTVSAKNEQQLKIELQRIIDDTFQPVLAVVFSGIDQSHQRIIDHLNSYSITVFGGTTAGEILDDDVLDDSISIMLFDIDRDFFHQNDFIFSDFNLAGHEIGAWIKKSTFRNPAVLMLVAVDLNTEFANNENFVHSIFEITGQEIPVFGGIAGDDNRYQSPLVFSHRGVYNNGVNVLVFDQNNIELSGFSVHGWRGIGTFKEITGSEKNIVYEIDGQPAFDFYKKYVQMGGIFGQNKLINEYPIQLHRPDGSVVLRVPMIFNDQDKSIVFGGDFPKGSKIRFTSPSITEVISECLVDVQNFKQMKQLEKIHSLILFSCAIRHTSLGQNVREEVTRIRSLWNVPQIGLFTYGEIGALSKSRCDFHNNTISLVTIKIKDTPFYNYKPEVKEGVQLDQQGKIRQLEQRVDELSKEKAILSNFLHRTTEDLDEALAQLRVEQQKSENLLLNILPAPIAEILKDRSGTIAERFDDVAILFADIVGFTGLASENSAVEIVDMLNELFSIFDQLTEKYNIEKIKTIGDAYMAVGGLPVPDSDCTYQVARMALNMIKLTEEYAAKKNLDLSIRIGINYGEVVAGVIGRKKFIYDLWGDAVNIASRMESNGIAGRIQVTEAMFNKTGHMFNYEKRGTIPIKGRGQMTTYFLLNEKD